MNLSYNATFKPEEWTELSITNLAIMEGDHIITGSEDDAAFIKSQLLFMNIPNVVVHTADIVTVQISKANIVYFTQRPRQLAITPINGNTTLAYTVTM